MGSRGGMSGAFHFLAGHIAFEQSVGMGPIFGPLSPQHNPIGNVG